MNEINYQALREVAERAITAMERLLMLPADDDLLSEQELKDYGVDIDALNAFKFLTGPETVLALLDELDKWKQESSAWQSVAEKQLALATNAEQKIAELESLTAPQLPQQAPVVTDEMTPEMMRAVQLNSELGAYAVSNLSGAYDLFAEFWKVACRAAMLQGSEPVTDNTNQQFESLSRGDKMNNTLTIINMLSTKGIATVRTPSGIQFMGSANASQQDKAMMNRITQAELDAALKWQR